MEDIAAAAAAAAAGAGPTLLERRHQREGANVPHLWRTFLFVLHKYMMLAFCKKRCDTAAGHRNHFAHTKTS